MSDTENGRRRRNVLAVSAVAGVLLAGGGYLAYSATAPGVAVPDVGTGPTVGPAASAEGGTGSGDARSGRGIAPGEPDPGGGPGGTVYTAKGPLPQGPSSAAVHRPEGLVTSAEVTRLAAALGLAGSPALVGDVWTIRPEKDGSGPRLDVARKAPGNWSYSWFDGGPIGDACLKGPACPPPGEGKPSTGGAPPSEAAARAAAAPVLKALGQDDAKITANRVVDGSLRLVNADPVVDGLPTHGWSTGLHIGRDGRPVSGSGTLKEPAKDGVYPVIAAEKALAALNEDARTSGPVGTDPCPAGAPRGVDGAGKPGGPGGVDGAGEPGGGDRVDGNGKPGVGGTTGGGGGITPEPPCRKVAGTTPPQRVPVTGAVFALAARDVAGERLLVPSWLFTADPVDGPPYTVVREAVAPELLARSAKPSASPTVPPSDGTAPARQVQSYRAEDGGRKLTVSFWGGVCSTYTVTAEERPERVAVRIVEKATEPGKVCVALAQEFTRTVTLDAPLGSRPVVDAASGETVPRR
ncbi:hypothetical protein ACIRQY_09520 [Streptomyces sp. NPDC101490]|uniref:hypothetical protein n=1 Tax=Streptomyces sp. NPDC101490 TaxID=3366143 RepID=UPI0037F21810